MSTDLGQIQIHSASSVDPGKLRARRGKDVRERDGAHLVAHGPLDSVEPVVEHGVDAAADGAAGVGVGVEAEEAALCTSR